MPPACSQVLSHRLRHVPLFPATFNPEPGLRVEGYLHDCWWPGEVVEQHPRKGFRICFDDGDNAWLVRRNVRPMLRRAPHAGHFQASLRFQEVDKFKKKSALRGYLGVRHAASAAGARKLARGVLKGLARE